MAATCTEDPRKRSQVKAGTGGAVAGGANTAPAARAPSVTRAEDHSQARERERESPTPAPARRSGRDHDEVEEEETDDGEREERDDSPGDPPARRGVARSGKL